MTTKRAEVLVGSGNYFHWEYNMRMTLARKGLLAHVQVIKVENKITEAWLTNDAKALAISAQGYAMETWNTLREYYIRTTLHNRFAMTRRLHEFKTEEGTPMAKPLDAFDELVVGLQTLGEPVHEARQLVVIKEKLLKEHERLHKKETTKKAFRYNGNAGRFKGGRGSGGKGNSPKKNGGFKCKCYKL
ncbi:polyprotein [Phytophthora palmivora]|uniref:Polyprotein n=1 Tax=Phytophthora palmivora TaxID=4796 RepID=A0A2P4XCJ0_9STRA|nr:polyprotein [Phytophthora palmivora]